jgi:hypothetical protein
MVALEDGPFEWIPTWTCLDYTNGFVSGFDIRRGRQSDYSTTDTSTATVYLNDTTGVLDPGNTGSPFYGVLDGAQIALQCWDPIEEEWVRQTRMWIDDITFDFNPATSDGKSILSNVQLQCVDLFDHLARTNFVLGVFGDTPPSGSEGTVYYNVAPVDDRIAAMLIEGGLSTDWYVLFTGNVDVQALGYDASDVILTGIRDACDAEFPDIANCYTDKLGRFCFHGRGAYFDPDAVSATAGDAAWNFIRWKAGDGEAWVADNTRAQIRPPLRWARPRSRIRNSGYCTPRGVSITDKEGQVFEDAVSIAKYRRRPWNAEGLIVEEGTTTGFTALQECAAFAEWQVTQRANPTTLVDALTLKSIPLEHEAAEATWALLLRGDIADIIDLEHGYPGAGGVGVSDDFYVQGSEMSVSHLNPAYDMVTTTYNVSSAADYGDDLGLLG